MSQRKRSIPTEFRDAVANGYDYDHHLNVEENRERATEEGSLLQELVTDADFDLWREEGVRLLFEATAHQWAIAEWIMRGEDMKEIASDTRDQRFKHAIYSAASDIFDFTVNMVKDYAYVARNVPPEIRVEELSFGHHKLVASLSPELQRKFLTEMQTGRLTIGDSKRRIRHELNQGQPKPKPNDDKDLRAKKIIRLCDQLADSLDYLTAAMPVAYWTLMQTVAKAHEVLEQIEAASAHTDAVR